MSQDRRIQKTKRSATEALMSLIIEKGFETITVQDILDRANMGRSTFYAHFRDKTDLLRDGFLLFQNSLEAQHSTFLTTADSKKTSSFNISLELFMHAQSHLALYKAMIGRDSGAYILKYVQELMQQRLKKYLSLKLKGKKNESKVDLLSHWIVGSFLSTLVWWLDGGCAISAKEVDEIFRELTLKSVEKYLGVETIFF